MSAPKHLNGITAPFFLLIFLLPLEIYSQSSDSVAHEAGSSESTEIFATSRALTIKFSIPEGNHFYINKGDSYGSSYGFLGFSYGMEYFFSDNHSLDLKVGVALDKPSPVPSSGPEPEPGEKQQETGVNFVALQKGQEWKKWHAAFGIQLSTTYYFRSTTLLLPDTTITTRSDLKQQQLGAAFSCYVKAGKIWGLGVNYFPSFIGWEYGRTRFHYTHLIMAEVIIRITTKVK